MKTLARITIAMTLTAIAGSNYAQQVPMYTNYMYNTLVVNPAYAGSRDALTVTALDRSQWVDFKGAPVTQTLTIQAPLPDQHFGVGFSLLNDAIGPTNNTSLFADFAYKMQLTEKSKLALGLSGGVDILSANLTSVQLNQQNDPAFQTNINNQLSPNFGFGAYYSRERFYAGISIPELVQSNYSAANQENGTTLISKEQRSYFLIMGTLLPISENLDFKPTMLIKETAAAPVEADLTASFILMKKVLLGVMFRSGDAFGVLLGLDVTEQLHVGYSYDYSYGLQTYKYNEGSHEIVLRYDFLLFDKKQIHSPRYF